MNLSYPNLMPPVHKSDIPIFRTKRDLIRAISGIKVDEKHVKITDDLNIRKSMDILAFNAVDFGKELNVNLEIVSTARYLIKEIGLQLGIMPASIFPFYVAASRGKIGRKMTVAAINLRGDTYNSARALFRAANTNNVGPLIIEISKEEMDYTFQSPAEYAAIITAAAIREKFKGCLFLQGDHFKIDATKYWENPDDECRVLEELIQESVAVGFGHIDIDASTLEYQGEKKLCFEERVKENVEATALLINFIRHVEIIKKLPFKITIGSELGEIGKKNTTIEEYKAYMALLNDKLAHMDIENGISKISVNTGTAHGGIRLSNGTIEDVAIDFDTLSAITREARKDGLAGAVQHGASTLPNEMFRKFVEHNTIELHLSTAFQDIIMKNMPKDLLEKFYNWVRINCSKERSPKQTEIQFLLTYRKKAWGIYREDVWRMDEGARIQAAAALEAKFSFLFQQLNLVNTRDLIEKFVPSPKSRVM